MHISILPPSPHLQPFVEVYLDLHSETGEVGRKEESFRLFPNPLLSMAFSYGAVKASVQLEGRERFISPSYSLGGSCSRPKEYVWQGEMHTFAIAFKPWGVRSLTRFPLQETTNQHIDLHHIFGNRLSGIEERLCACHSPYERRGVVEAFLSSELMEHREDCLVIDAVEQIARAKGSIHVQKMADHYGLSRKQFVRRFQETTGLPPKLFSRITRFQHTLSLLNGPVRHIEVAYESGYFDQAHYTKEFRELTGISPGKFFSTLQRSRLGEEFDQAAPMSPFYNAIYQ